MSENLKFNVNVKNPAGKIQNTLAGTVSVNTDAAELLRNMSRASDTRTVKMQRSSRPFTKDLLLWVVIRESTDRLSFENYTNFIDLVLCKNRVGATDEDKSGLDKFDALKLRRFLPYNDTEAYRLLKVATEAFLLVNCGSALNSETFGDDDIEKLLELGINDPQADPNDLWKAYLEKVEGLPEDLKTLPYFARIRSKFQDLDITDVPRSIDDKDSDLIEKCYHLIRRKLTNPCLLELIWSYWHEEGMLVQAMNTISMRFQNMRLPDNRNPLAMMEIDPLRPLNNLLWGYIQDEQHRLTVLRRVYEYDHHYGLSLYGKAVPQLQAADSRSKFIEAFHTLLYLTTIFFKEDDDTTIVADGFPLLNALKEVHLILSEGAHNQFGDLPATARVEMLMQQWLLARAEFRDFLPTRTMVAYPENWMGRVDAMKNLMGWSDASVLHFRNLGVFGEQLLLAIRYGDWNSVNDPNQASNWAKYWRAEIQGYIHAYRTVTGVDLTADVSDGHQAGLRYLPPSVHLRQRLLQQQNQRGALSPGTMPTRLPNRQLMRR